MHRVQNAQSHTEAFAPDILVVGSCFLDYVGYVDHMPQVGETMHSDSFQKNFGGKGGNQAVAAGRLGAKVAMMSMVGTDGDGSDYIKELEKNGVNTSHMLRTGKSTTGLAMIFVDKTSHNEIVINPNATHHFTPELARAQTANWSKILHKGLKYLICQNEIPLATTLEVIKEAHSRGVYTVFNTAPAPTPKEVVQIKPFLPCVSLFCPNEVEAALMTGVKVTDTESAFRAIKALNALGVRDVVITLGAAGFALSEKGATPVHVKGKRVKAVDTTGAGDCFVGSMVFFLNRGHNLLDACKRANECAAISVTRKGTQKSYPTPSELPAGVM
ncbi:putative ribokinase [Leptomonas pyrrhocoris]|uniref:Ribokinase n=1 Tax=Leptomonas pyrrhocoris TaxID=157538 RepID=A0A0M9FPY4_LEPPY|nr:putative ribokinase [Leptomonas pyrrhocoris]KPA73496.1 putative ribokinase [Leptomonas pyrrhocoris]|eukprot:XP_015651935.1 putative ribokinase [Leptomonas pyrrhocoris]